MTQELQVYARAYIQHGTLWHSIDMCIDSSSEWSAAAQEARVCCNITAAAQKLESLSYPSPLLALAVQQSASHTSTLLLSFREQSIPAESHHS